MGSHYQNLPPSVSFSHVLRLSLSDYDEYSLLFNITSNQVTRKCCRLGSQSLSTGDLAFSLSILYFPGIILSHPQPLSWESVIMNWFRSEGKGLVCNTKSQVGRSDICPSYSSAMTQALNKNMYTMQAYRGLEDCKAIFRQIPLIWALIKIEYLIMQQHTTYTKINFRKNKDPQVTYKL